MRTLGSILVVILATMFELLGRVLHSVASVAMSTAIMLLGIVSDKDLSE